MRRITSVSLMKIGETVRVAYCYDDTDDSGECITQNQRGSYISDDDETALFLRKISDRIISRLNQNA